MEISIDEKMKVWDMDAEFEGCSRLSSEQVSLRLLKRRMGQLRMKKVCRLHCWVVVMIVQNSFMLLLQVNRIRELPQNSKIVATHTDSPDVLIWDVESQPNRHAVLGASASRPDLVLTGHQDNAEFTLAMCPVEPFMLSGGKDKSVVLWSIHDHISTFLRGKATVEYGWCSEMKMAASCPGG